MAPARKKSTTTSAKELVIRSLTPSRWEDLVKLFGERGACGGCWCMYWRQTSAEFSKNKGAPNQRAFRRVVESRKATGVLGYLDGEPVAWCAIAPRAHYPRLGRSRILAPVDDTPVWSVSCFFVTRPHRRQGHSVRLLEGAVEYARKKGARVVEGYANDPSAGPMPDAFAWCGIARTFEQAGFREVARRSATRPILRRTLRDA